MNQQVLWEVKKKEFITAWFSVQISIPLINKGLRQLIMAKQSYVLKPWLSYRQHIIIKVFVFFSSLRYEKRRRRSWRNGARPEVTKNVTATADGWTSPSANKLVIFLLDNWYTFTITPPCKALRWFVSLKISFLLVSKQNSEIFFPPPRKPPPNWFSWKEALCEFYYASTPSLRTLSYFGFHKPSLAFQNGNINTANALH